MKDDYKRLGREYKKTSRILARRIRKVKKERDKLKTKDIDTAEIDERLSMLNAMHRDVNEIGKEAANYYERSWWRSEKYTLNSRKSRLPVFYHGYIIKEQEDDEREEDQPDEGYLDASNQ